MERSKNPDNKIDINHLSLKFKTPLTLAIGAPSVRKEEETYYNDPVDSSKLEIIQYLISKDAKVNYDGRDLPSKSDQEQLNYDIKGPGDNKKSQVRLTFLQPLMQAVKVRLSFLS